MTLEWKAMGTVSTVRPAWAREAFVNAVWVATAETPEWIAAQTDALLTRLQGSLNIGPWETWKGDPWEGSPEELASIVRSCVVRESISEGVEGDSLPNEGYSLVLLGNASEVAVRVWINAGSVAVGRKMPRHHLKVDLRETAAGGVTSRMGDSICEAVANTWNPSSLKLADTATNRIARRGGWKIGVGYRTWISSDVGTVGQVTDGLTVSELAGGTVISAPDDWPAERVVDAMTTTLTANGLDEIPR